MVDTTMVAPGAADSASADGAAMLSVENLEAWYGESHVLHGINFNVRAGEVVTLLGRNGAGKTTTLKSVMGINLSNHAPARYEAKAFLGKVALRGHLITSSGRNGTRSPGKRHPLEPLDVLQAVGMLHKAALDVATSVFPNPAHRMQYRSQSA